MVIPLAALGIAAAIWLVAVSVAKPRLLLYGLIALSPTQFLFIPVADFFISPADVLLLGAAVGLTVRLATLQPSAWSALYQHRFLLLMLGAYLVGFVILNVFSRTIVRLPIGITASVAATELLRTRRQLWRAATAIIFAGVLDAAYGLYFIARGTPLHPQRFSGMSDVNFSAMVIMTAAAVALAQIAGTHRPIRLMRPGALFATALATLSQMGVVAAVSAWGLVLRRVVSRTNKARIAMAAVLLLAVALMAAPVRDRFLERNVRQVQRDGVARNSADIRWMVLQTVWQGVTLHPFTGVGYFQFLEFSNTNPDIQLSTSGQGILTHNTYAEVLVEGGMVTFFIFSLHWVQYLRRFPLALRTILRKRDTVMAACLVGFPIVLISAALANLLLIYSFWAICGVSLAALNLLARETREAAGT